MPNETPAPLQLRPLTTGEVAGIVDTSARRALRVAGRAGARSPAAREAAREYIAARQLTRGRAPLVLPDAGDAPDAPIVTPEDRTLALLHLDAQMLRTPRRRPLNAPGLLPDVRPEDRTRPGWRAGRKLARAARALLRTSLLTGDLPDAGASPGPAGLVLHTSGLVVAPRGRVCVAGWHVAGQEDASRADDVMLVCALALRAAGWHVRPAIDARVQLPYLVASREVRARPRRAARRNERARRRALCAAREARCT